MSFVRHLLWSGLVTVALIGSAAPVEAQGKGKKHYVVSSEKAVSVTRTVLIRQGYTVVRVKQMGPTHVVYYRRGNMGKGKGKGPIQHMVIRTVRDRVIFEETEPSVLVAIDVRLKI